MSRSPSDEVGSVPQYHYAYCMDRFWAGKVVPASVAPDDGRNHL